MSTTPSSTTASSSSLTATATSSSNDGVPSARAISESDSKHNNRVSLSPVAASVQSVASHHRPSSNNQDNDNSNSSSFCCGKRPRPPQREDSGPPQQVPTASSFDASEVEPNKSEREQSEQQCQSPLWKTQAQARREDRSGNHGNERTIGGEPCTKIRRSSPTPSEEQAQAQLELERHEDTIEEEEEDSEEEEEEDSKPAASATTKSESSFPYNTTTREEESKEEDKQQAVEDFTQTKLLPLAPRLKDYMEPGATFCFRPRPEWYQATPAATAYPQRYGMMTVEQQGSPGIPQTMVVEPLLASMPTGILAAAPLPPINLAVGPVYPPYHYHPQAPNHYYPQLAPQPPMPPLPPPPLAPQAGLMVAPDDGLLPDEAFDGIFHRHPRNQNHQRHDNNDDAPDIHALNGNRDEDANDDSDSDVAFFLNAASSRSIDDIMTNPAITTTTNVPSFATFGRDFDTALHMTIRDSATEAALGLLEYGAPVEAENAKGITPLILASQKGNFRVVQELLERGASPARSSANGTTAVMQAAHFGYLECLELLLQRGGYSLIEMANFNETTPLMRAAQEGHVSVVKMLLGRGATVNRHNRVQMTALMLASQRGHYKVCQVLVEKGAELDSMTSQRSTALSLAAKRGNVEVARVLITAGCELWAKDSRGRCAREVAQRKNIKEMVPLLDAHVQLDLMQRQQRKQRNYVMMAVWNLLQKERAFVPIQSPLDESLHRNATGHMRQVAIHQFVQDYLPSSRSTKVTLSMNSPLVLPPALPHNLSQKSTQALLRTMTLPAPLVELITKFLPLPHLWDRRVGMLTRRSVVNADATVTCALDLIDEILEEGGFVEACDYSKVTPPTHFASWVCIRYYFGRRQSSVPHV